MAGMFSRRNPMITGTRHKKTGDFCLESLIMESMRNRIGSVTLVVALVVHCWVANVCAHEFERGHIERSIDVVVRGSKVEVKYSLGLSDETIVDLLVDEDSLGAADEQRFRKCIAQYESGASAERDASSEKSDSTEKIPDDGKNRNETAAEPLAFQTELIELLKEKLAPKISEGLGITANQISIVAEEPVFSTSPRHHVAMEIVLRASLTKMTPTELSVIDRNFLEVDTAAEPNVAANSSEIEATKKDSQTPSFRYFGNIRLACRVKGDAVQLNSNVAPVLARAKAVDTELLDLDQRVSAASIVTRIGFVESGKR